MINVNYYFTESIPYKSTKSTELKKQQSLRQEDSEKHSNDKKEDNNDKKLIDNNKSDNFNNKDGDEDKSTKASDADKSTKASDEEVEENKDIDPNKNEDDDEDRYREKYLKAINKDYENAQKDNSFLLKFSSIFILIYIIIIVVIVINSKKKHNKLVEEFIPIPKELQNQNISKIKKLNDNARIRFIKQYNFILNVYNEFVDKVQDFNDEKLFFFDDIIMTNGEYSFNNEKFKFNKNQNIFSEDFFLIADNKGLFSDNNFKTNRSDLLKTFQTFYQDSYFNVGDIFYRYQENNQIAGLNSYWLEKLSINEWFESFEKDIKNKIKALGYNQQSLEKFYNEFVQYDILLYIEIISRYNQNENTGNRDLNLEEILRCVYELDSTSCIMDKKIFIENKCIHSLEVLKKQHIIIDKFTDEAEKQYYKKEIELFVQNTCPNNKVIYNNILQQYYLDNASFLWTKKEELEECSKIQIANNEDNYLSKNYLDILNQAIENYKATLIGQEITRGSFFYIFLFSNSKKKYKFIEVNSKTWETKLLSQITKEEIETFEKLKYNVVIK